MSDLVKIAIITIVPATISAVFSGFAFVTSNRAHDASLQNGEKMDEVKKSVDGTVDKLMNIRGAASFEEGIKEQKRRAAE